MKLGMVTYNMGKDMDCPALIGLCKQAGLSGVELRTTHAHKVEVELSREQRGEVRRLFADSGIELAGLGSAFDYHSTDLAEVKQSIEGSIAYAQLAADVGAPGIKVRPNGLPEGVPVEKTCEQIGNAIRQVAVFADGIGVQVRLEVHGKATSEPKIIRQIMDFADHPNARVCWNSNESDMDASGSIQSNFDLLKDKIALVHINEIGVPKYPWKALFDNLSGMKYAGYCLAEIAYNPEPERFMRYYRTLFDFYTGAYRDRQA